MKRPEIDCSVTFQFPDILQQGKTNASLKVIRLHIYYISILCKNYAENPIGDIRPITFEQEKNPELKLIYWKMVNIDGISVEQLNLKTF